MIANHLWQSTLFVAVVAWLTFVLRKNRAQVRYWVWLTASIKFLAPFAALVALGKQFALRGLTTTADSHVTLVFDAVGRPFSQAGQTLATVASPMTTAPALNPALPVLLRAIWLAGCAVVLVTWWIRWRRVSAVIRAGTPMYSGREWQILLRLDATSLRLVSSDTSLEPGVFGILRPILLWPRSISGRLTDEQIEAILAHELAHVRRRDNLAAALHMLVQTLFWFHPLVWWVGARLVDERERACDEEVIRQGSEPQVYAESILKTCEFYVEAPVVCVAGVTGSDLKRRIEAIMTNRIAPNLGPGRKILLAAAGIAAIMVPVGIGIVWAPRLRAQAQPVASQRFEVASIKPWKLTDSNSREARILARGADPSSTLFIPTETGRFTATAVTLKRLIALAYLVEPSRVSGGPDWIATDRYTIEAKAEEGAVSTGEIRARVEQLRAMLRALLADRFALQIRHEVKVFPVYALAVAKGGPKLQAATDRDCLAVSTERLSPCHWFNGGNRAGMTGQAVDMADLASVLTPLVDRPVVDRTGIKGLFDMKIDPWNPFANEVPEGAGQGNEEFATVDFNTLPTLFTLLPDKFGLKLDRTKAPLDTIVIDSVQRLSED